jgi:hypothetical protein
MGVIGWNSGLTSISSFSDRSNGNTIWRISHRNRVHHAKRDRIDHRDGTAAAEIRHIDASAVRVDRHATAQDALFRFESYWHRGQYRIGYGVEHRNVEWRDRHKGARDSAEVQTRNISVHSHANSGNAPHRDDVNYYIRGSIEHR